ncbi:hypothetical protein Ab1vBOLIVR5_gp203c [Agrobacterium phage OLIVR5]|uniref:Uncharacterized protein n=1 Tax=Agrobacterium phage OLIVR5 TaxID=2723773 RepID=A0A858MTV2_9CAUD|nr:hypothetical protein KNU99_gp198 [Agrobacterium phage OLIVR5]QIW87851.1 hypothetical protein Ab1vBOLIVR5_gp203c [Agrobacterium phage OLIVR5]QIW88116.1 hypothetical protein Ab1vBOLIVR6_gp209c [Agrobacterium phage OLIVR6]
MDLFLSILTGIGASTTFAFFVVLVVVCSQSYFRSKRNSNDIKKMKKTEKSVSSLKQRIFEEKVYHEDVVDIHVVEGMEDEFNEMVQNTSEEFVQKQARFFFSCALNLMAHSYKDMDEVKRVAQEMLELELEY